jgi:predicted permease
MYVFAIAWGTILGFAINLIIDNVPDRTPLYLTVLLILFTIFLFFSIGIMITEAGSSKGKEGSEEIKQT